MGMIKSFRPLFVLLVSIIAAFVMIAAGSVSSVVAKTASAPEDNRPKGQAKGGDRGRTTGMTALSPYAEDLARTIGFDRRVLVIVKEETGSRIQRLVGYDVAGYQIVAPGIAALVPEDRGGRILASLRKKLAHLGYMAFAAEMNDALRIDKIGVLKGSDRYDILRVMHTNGRQHDLSNRDVISRLKSWERICSFTIVGADNDWVEIEFRSLPKNLTDFAGEVYDFSPDAVDRGPGTVEGLIQKMKKRKRLLLWWDE